MPFPRNRAEMIKQKYKPAPMAECRGCGALIEFWITPAGKNMPMDRMEKDDSPAITHFATCPKRDTFRKGARP